MDGPEPLDEVESEPEYSDCSEAEDVDVGHMALAEPPPAVPSTQRVLRTGPKGLQPPRTLETTLFDRLERMYGPSIKRMLTVQYR
jgi:DNA polymerase alpha-associated DNA helicase A